jgi:hypothetical protein
MDELTYRDCKHRDYQCDVDASKCDRGGWCYLEATEDSPELDVVRCEYFEIEDWG